MTFWRSAKVRGLRLKGPLTRIQLYLPIRIGAKRQVPPGLPSHFRALNIYIRKAAATAEVEEHYRGRTGTGTLHDYPLLDRSLRARWSVRGNRVAWVKRYLCAKILSSFRWNNAPTACKPPNHAADDRQSK
jgi:hypothetical protein